MLESALLNNILISFCYLLFTKHNNNNSTEKTNSFPYDSLIKCKIK